MSQPRRRRRSPGRSARSRLAAGALCAGLAAGCGGSGGTTPDAPDTPAPSGGVRAVTLADGLDHPWSLAFLPDGSMLVTERAGRLLRLGADGARLGGPVRGVPAVDARGQGGLFDVLPAPDFAASRTLFLSYAEAGQGDESGRNGTAVLRARLSDDGSALADTRVIFRQQPKVAGSAHFGGRLVFGNDGLLYVTLGERQSRTERERAQDLAAGHGKVMRIRPDGSVPPDNPFVATAGAQPAIWSYGHRNPQGAAIHPQTGELWAIEHGPQGGDELNVVRAGNNYGWPRVSHGCEYGAPVGRCTPVGGASTGAGYAAPLTYWGPTSIAPSGMTFYTGNRFPQWSGQLFVGALADRTLWRLELDGTQVVRRETVPGVPRERIRDVRQGPDGWLYLLTDSSDGRLLRLQR